MRSEAKPFTSASIIMNTIIIHMMKMWTTMKFIRIITKTTMTMTTIIMMTIM